jgi:hypothetical protein
VNVEHHAQVRLGQGSKKRKSFPDKTGSKNKILSFGSSHARKIGRMHRETLGKIFDIVSIVKPNAPLGNVVEDLGKLGNNFTKKDHIVIVSGPGNNLGRNYNCSIEKKINFIAERSANTNARFV